MPDAGRRRSRARPRGRRPGSSAVSPPISAHARRAADLGGALDELGDLLEIEPVRGDVVEQDQRRRRRVVITSLMQCAAMSAPQARSARARARRSASCRSSRWRRRAAGRRRAGGARRTRRSRRAGRLDGRAQPLDDPLGRRERDPGGCVRPVFAHRPSLRGRLGQQSACSCGRPCGPPGQEAARSRRRRGRSRRRARARAARRAPSAFASGSSASSWSSVERELVGRSRAARQPVARRMHLEPVAGVRRDERSPAAVRLDPQVPLDRPLEHLVELVLVEREPEVVDARQLPLAGLDDDVDGAALELGSRSLKPMPVELLPRDPGLERLVVLADPAVARDERRTRACRRSAPRPGARGS